MSTFSSASASASASSSRSFASKLRRFWSSNAQVASTTDIEAQLPVIPVPAPAHITTSARLPSASDASDDYTDAIDDFFGVTYSREERRARRLAQTQALASAAPTHASRHDAPVYIPDTPSEDEKDPPSYADSDKESDCATIVADLPTYSEAVQVSSFDSESEQPWCIPQGLFRYGFFCPLLWFLGVLFLFNFHAPSDLSAFYSAEESAARMRELRAAEKKWAYRCLLAIVALLFLALVIVGAMFMIMIVMKRT